MSAVDERHFQNWLNADRAHRLAFDRMRVLWGQLEMPARKLANRRQGRLLPGLMAWFGLRRIVAAAAGVAAMLALTWYVKPGLVQDWRADIVAEGRVILVSTHDLGSVPEYCDRVVLVKGTVLASGPVATTFTPENLKRAFGGVLRHFSLGGATLHDDDDPREVSIITDDERPFVHYGDPGAHDSHRQAPLTREPRERDA